MTKMENTPAIDEILVSSQEQALKAPAWGLAKTISVLFSPPLLGTLGLFLVADKIGGRNIWLWTAVYGFACIALPIAYLISLIRNGEVSDFHIRNRLERIKPMKAVLLLFSLTTLIFLAAGAPYILQVFAFVGAIQTSVMLLVTFRWKISGHGAGAAGFAALLLGLYGAKAAPALLIIPIVVWARVYLDRHDLGQTLAGALVGLSFMAMVFALVASHCPGAGLVCI
jgi:hypothetical protein